jgi:predicted dehydrogenase
VQEGAARPRVAIAGLGRRGLDQLELLVGRPDAWELVAVADRSPVAYARLQAHHYELRIPFVRSAAELVAFEPELVLVATTAPGHVPVALDLIGAGFTGALLIEKPLATSVAAARDLHRAVTDGWPGRAAVCFQRRCSPMYAEIVRALRSGELGAIRRVRLTTSSPEPISMSGSHLIDLVDWLVGEEPVHVAATLAPESSVTRLGAYYFDPSGTVEIAYSGGATAVLDLTGAAGREGAGLAVECERGAARVSKDEDAAVVSERQIAGDGGMADWFETLLGALVGRETGVAPCSIEEGVAGLEVLAGAFLSSERGGAPHALPLTAADAAAELRIA